MISEKMQELVNGSSAIREMFEEGKRLMQEFGEEKVYDFSLGNPSVHPPKEIKRTMIELLDTEDENFLHGYMNNSGFEDVRRTIASHLNTRYKTTYDEKNLVMTVGAAGGLNVILKTLLNKEDEVIVFAPYFSEYRNYISNYDGITVEIAPDYTSFQLNLEELEQKITKKTKAVIINNPNNPTGVVYSIDTIKELAKILNQKQKEYNTSIYLISDEPYRELVYEGVTVPYIPKVYSNTIVGYSFSKSLSLPGERIGYLILPKELEGFDSIVAAANVATRILGFVNAPSLMQRVIAKCMDCHVDIDVYNQNRELLYQSLIKFGYTCVKPEGAFYLFVKVFGGDDRAFVEAAKKHHLLLVPGSGFGCAGYCRIAYCVDTEMIKRALPVFEALAKEYQTMGTE